MRKAQELELKKIDAQGFPRTWEALQLGVASGVAPGMVAGVWRASDPDSFHCASIGQRRLIPTPQPLHAETPFDLASLTKVLATAPLMALLIDRKWVRWETRVCDILADYPDREIRIEHLLSHTAGFPAWKPFWEMLREAFSPQPLYKVPLPVRQKEMRRRVFEVPREAAPGSRALYSDVTFLLLGFVIEELLQKPLDRAVDEFLWRPLGVDQCFYQRVTEDPERGRHEFVAATEDSAWRGGILQGQVHDDNCWSMGGFGGHAGAFGSARQVLQLVRAFFGGAFSRETLSRMWSRVPAPPGCERTLGWDTPSGPESSAGRLFSPHTVGHLGFTGTSLWIDLEAELAVLLLTNRVHPSRENVKIRAFRPRFHDAIRTDLIRLDSKS